MNRIFRPNPAQARRTPTMPNRRNAPSFQPLPADSVRFGQGGKHHEATEAHTHGPTCNHETPSVCPTKPHEHGPDCDHTHPKKSKEPNWFSRFFSGLKNDVEKFYNMVSNWIKKLFSSKEKKE
jgi:hypothetical protein